MKRRISHQRRRRSMKRVTVHLTTVTMTHPKRQKRRSLQRHHGRAPHDQRIRRSIQEHVNAISNTKMSNYCSTPWPRNNQSVFLTNCHRSFIEVLLLGLLLRIIIINLMDTIRILLLLLHRRCMDTIRHIRHSHIHIQACHHHHQYSIIRP